MRHGETEKNSNDAAQKVADTDQSLLTLARAISVGDSGQRWRDYCLNGRKTFPAGVTYLSQLLAHDLTHSAKLDNDISQKRKAGHRVNLRKNQLLLDTLYGEGPVSDPQLFDGDQVGIGKTGYVFKLLDLENSNKGLVKTVPSFAASVPWIFTENEKRCHPKFADVRNADHPIIMRMTTLLMMYHNCMMEPGTGQSSHEEYLEARIKTTLAWHKIIRNDIINSVCMVRRNKDFDRKLSKAISKKPDVIETDFLQGLLRAFHCLTIPEYQLGEFKKTIKETLHVNAISPAIGDRAHPERLKILERIGEWQNIWDVDLAHFFTPDAKNQTAFTPSYAFNFNGNDEEKSMLILLRDRASGDEHGVSKITSPLYRHLIPKCETMLLDLKQQLNITDPLPDGHNSALHLAFLAEAHVEPEKLGTLGRTGSVLFYRIVESKIRSAQKLLRKHKDKATIEKWYSEAPDRFDELARLVTPDDERQLRNDELVSLTEDTPAKSQTNS